LALKNRSGREDLGSRGRLIIVEIVERVSDSDTNNFDAIDEELDDSDTD
jgi:hypothetical protein